jgi:hypothetical protein
MRHRFSLAELRHRSLREYRQRAEWEDDYRRAFKRDVFIHHAVRVTAWAIVSFTILILLFR